MMSKDHTLQLFFLASPLIGSFIISTLGLYLMRNRVKTHFLEYFVTPASAAVYLLTIFLFNPGGKTLANLFEVIFLLPGIIVATTLAKEIYCIFKKPKSFAVSGVLIVLNILAAALIALVIPSLPE